MFSSVCFDEANDYLFFAASSCRIFSKFARSVSGKAWLGPPQAAKKRDAKTRTKRLCFIIKFPYKNLIKIKSA